MRMIFLKRGKLHLFLLCCIGACSQQENNIEKIDVFSEVGEPLVLSHEREISYDESIQASSIDEVDENNTSFDTKLKEEIIEGKIVLGQTLLLSEENASVPVTNNLPPHDPSGGYVLLRYSTLTDFTYEIDWEADGLTFDFSAYSARVPKNVRSLSNTMVAIEGFMVPTVVDEENLVKEFLLMPDQLSCCFGQAPEANGWVVARSPRGVEVSMDRVIRVLGTLTVEERWDEEFFVGLYHLECDELINSAK